MGVQVYILATQNVALAIGHSVHKIGTLRRFWKVSEIDETRSVEIEQVALDASGTAVLSAVLIAEPQDLKIEETGERVSAHLVLGWDEDRSSVTDSDWDYLPQLGYAVRDQGTGVFRLYELAGSDLTVISFERAIELGIVDSAGSLIRSGQPLILDCGRVQPFITSYVQADCKLADGRTIQILTSVEAGRLPEKTWYIGKRPVDAQRFDG